MAHPPSAGAPTYHSKCRCGWTPGNGPLSYAAQRAHGDDSGQSGHFPRLRYLDSVRMAPDFSGHRLGIPESSDKQAVETKEQNL